MNNLAILTTGLKEVVEVLKSYPRNQAKIDMLRLELERFKNDNSTYTGVKGISYEQKGSKTNKFNSDVENEVIDREKRENELQSKIKDLTLMNLQIDAALNILTPREKEIIEKKYFKRMRNIDIAGDVNLTEEYLCDVRTGILKNLSGILFID